MLKNNRYIYLGNSSSLTVSMGPMLASAVLMVFAVYMLKPLHEILSFKRAITFYAESALHPLMFYSRTLRKGLLVLLLRFKDSLNNLNGVLLTLYMVFVVLFLSRVIKVSLLDIEVFVQTKSRSRTFDLVPPVTYFANNTCSTH